LTSSLRHQVFGGDEEPDPSALVAVGDDLKVDRVLSSPARAAVRTAEALDVVPEIEPALRDREYGEWTGRRYAELAAEQPDAVRRWLTDPSWAPPGGESVEQLVDRVGEWLSGAEPAVAVTHPAVIRAAVLHVLQAPPDSFRTIDVRPLTTARFSRHDDRWTFTPG
jgi:broad specificity phosphatase PhoE